MIEKIKAVLQALDDNRASISALLAVAALFLPQAHLTDDRQAAIMAGILALLAIGLGVADAIESHAPPKPPIPPPAV